MSVNCMIIAETLEKFAPCHLAESWDNVGLLVGQSDLRVEKILLTLDVTPEVIAEAIDTGSNLIVTHHPFPFKPGKTIRTDCPEGAMLASLLKNDIAVYAAHTNLDAAIGGVNDALATALGLNSVTPLKKAEERLVKIVVYVPSGHEEQVWQAMAEAGAGHIGQYSHCSFRVDGIGTFRPGEGTHPYIGTAGKHERVAEIRLETVAPAVLSGDVVRAMLSAHPYEEAAYDIYPMENVRHQGGLGRIGRLPAPVKLQEFACRVKKALDFAGVRGVGDKASRIACVAVCGGSGMELAGIARSAGADVLVTGDIRYHEAQTALAQGLCLVDAGHFATEIPVLETLRQWLETQAAASGWDCTVRVAERQSDLWWGL